MTKSISYKDENGDIHESPILIPNDNDINIKGKLTTNELNVSSGLTIQSGGMKSVNGNLIRQDTGYTDSATASNSAVRYNALYFQDSNSYINTYLEQAIETNGTIRSGFRIQKKTPSGYANHAIIQGSVDNAGNLSYNLGSVSAFRNLGFMGARIRDGHVQVQAPNGSEAYWLRCTQHGFIPYNNDSGASACDIGSGVGWQFRNIYGKNFVINGVGMSDFVVASGTSGNWEYWKFNSGLAICCMTAHAQNAGVGTNWGSCKYDTTKYGQPAYPFSFKTIPFATVSLVCPNGEFWATLTGGSASSAPGWYVVGPSSATKSITYSILAVGRWK